MKIHTLLILIFLVSISSARKPRNERFFRILKKYQDPNYKAKDRDFLFNFGYWSKYDEDEVDSKGFSNVYDDKYEFERDIESDFGIEIKRIGGDSIKLREFELTTSLNGDYDENSIKIKNDLIGKEYINEEQNKEISLKFNSSFDHSIYRKSFFSEEEREERLAKKGKTAKRNRFLGLDIAINGNAELTQNRSHTNDQLDDYNYSQEENSFFYGIAEGNVKLKIGFGRLYPLTPVIKAFQVERAMLESGVIKQELSDSIIIKIAQWIARENDYRIKHDRPEKFFYQMLDSILNTDSITLNITNNGYSYNYINETLKIPYAFLKKGFQFYLLGNQSATIDYDYYYNEEPELRGGFSFDWYQEPYALSLNWDLCYPLSSKLFLKTHIEKGFLYKHRSHYSTEIDIYPLSVYYDLSLYYWLNDRILLEGYANGVNSYLLIPKNWPSITGLTFNFFIADKIVLDLSLRKNSITDSDKFDFTPAYSEERISLGLRYDF